MEKMKIKYPKGFHKNGVAKIAVSFPEDVFETIIRRAKQENKTFNAMVIEQVKLGEFDMSESDQYEPKKVA